MNWPCHRLNRLLTFGTWFNYDAEIIIGQGIIIGSTKSIILSCGHFKGTTTHLVLWSFLSNFWKTGENLLTYILMRKWTYALKYSDLWNLMYAKQCAIYFLKSQVHFEMWAHWSALYPTLSTQTFNHKRSVQSALWMVMYGN